MSVMNEAELRNIIEERFLAKAVLKQGYMPGGRDAFIVSKRDVNTYFDSLLDLYRESAQEDTKRFARIAKAIKEYDVLTYVKYFKQAQKNGWKTLTMYVPYPTELGNYSDIEDLMLSNTHKTGENHE